MRTKVLFYFFAPLCLFAGGIDYDVRFAGVSDPILLSELTHASDLVSLKDRPPATINGLQYRAAADISKLLTVMRAYAFYDASIAFELFRQNDEIIVQLNVHPGTQYVLGTYEIFHGQCHDDSPIPNCQKLTARDVNLTLGQTADSTSILNAETALLTQVARCGYPLAYIDQRKIIVDMAEKTVDAAVCIEPGPLSHFGPITFFGLKDINPRFIERKIRWKEGDIYNPDLVEETQNRLIKSDLFSSVLISHAEEIDPAGELSMKVRLAEAKHRNISIGFFYATVDGPGGTICWTHRNLNQMGEYLSLEGNASKRFIAGTLTYRKSDFFALDQTLSAIGEASRENIIAYRAMNYLESNRLEHKFSESALISIGLKGEYINVHKSVNNGHFFVLGLPLYGKYANTKSPLDPTSGISIAYLATPYQSLNISSVHYLKQKLTASAYIPFTQNHKVVLALHAMIGSIAGARQKYIPLPKLFLGGSEDDLRGYGYKTVSPLGRRKGKTDKDSPRGGRSAIFTTIEFRFRVTQSIGIVPFADVGTVTLSEWPQIRTKWYTSVGGGLRYFTFFGPLRLDVGFPLDRRKNLDTWGKVYASIGQCF